MADEKKLTPEEEELKLRQGEIEANQTRLEDRRARKAQLAEEARGRREQRRASFREEAVLKDVPLVGEGDPEDPDDPDNYDIDED